MLGALCYVCVPNLDELTILTFQLELGEFAPGLEPLEFVSGECSSNIYIYICIYIFIYIYIYILVLGIVKNFGLD